MHLHKYAIIYKSKMIKLILVSQKLFMLYFHFKNDDFAKNYSIEILLISRLGDVMPLAKN